MWGIHLGVTDNRSNAMTTLDYATLFETEFRNRRRLRRTLLGVLAVMVWATPLAVFSLFLQG